MFHRILSPLLFAAPAGHHFPCNTPSEMRDIHADTTIAFSLDAPLIPRIPASPGAPVCALDTFPQQARPSTSHNSDSYTPKMSGAVLRPVFHQYQIHLSAR